MQEMPAPNSANINSHSSLVWKCLIFVSKKKSRCAFWYVYDAMPAASVISVFLFHRQKISNGFMRPKVQKITDRTNPIRIFLRCMLRCTSIFTIKSCSDISDDIPWSGNSCWNLVGENSLGELFRMTSGRTPDGRWSRFSAQGLLWHDFD